MSTRAEDDRRAIRRIVTLLGEWEESSQRGHAATEAEDAAHQFHDLETMLDVHDSHIQQLKRALGEDVLGRFNRTTKQPAP